MVGCDGIGVLGECFVDGRMVREGVEWLWIEALRKGVGLCYMFRFLLIRVLRSRGIMIFRKLIIVCT